MSGRSHRNEFTDMERRLAFENNSELLKKQFPDAVLFKNTPHYICESCGFVSRQSRDFNIDHVFPVAQGGTRNRVGKQVNAQLRDAQRADAGEAEIGAAIELLFRVGQNAAVLCTECNNRKSDLLYVPDGCGLAYTRHTDDLNPVHMVSGPPRPFPRW
jgi:5-methylcytosine-specific restriction endonuclease McrA